MPTRGARRRSRPALAADPGGSPPARRSAGFSLLEVMIALAILVVGVVGATAGQVIAMRVSTTSRDHTLAMHLAEQQMEVFRGMSASDVKGLAAEAGYPNDPANPIDPDPADGNPMRFDRRWFVAPDTPEANMITVTVEVGWLDSLGNPRVARVQGLKADR